MTAILVVIVCMLLLVALSRPRTGPRGQDAIDPRPVEPKSYRPGPVVVQDIDD